MSFSETTIIVWDLAEVLHAYFLYLTQNIKKMCQSYKDDIKTSGLRFNKIKGFWFIKGSFKWRGLLEAPLYCGYLWWNVRLSVPFGDTSLIHVKTPVILTHTLLLYHWYKCTHSEKGSKHNNELSVPWKGLEDLYFRSLTPKYMDHTVRATDLIQSLHFMRKRSWKRPTQDSPIS